MSKPRTPGCSMPNFSRSHDEESAQIRLDDDQELQRTFLHLHRCGPSITALAIAALLDQIGISSKALDLLADWRRVDPRQCSFNFDAPIMKRPRPRPRRPDYLRLVPPTGSER
jgi:hypothetical protein